MGTAGARARGRRRHPDGNTVLLERIEGEAYFAGRGDAREQLAEQFVEILAALHTTDLRTLDLPCS